MKRLIEFLVLAPAAALAIPVLVDSALKGAVLLAAILVGIRALRHSSAALRHFVLIASMFALLALPILSLTLPDWRVLPAWANFATSVETPVATDIASSEVMADIVTSTASLASGNTAGLEPTAEAVTNWIPIASWIWLAGGTLLSLWLAAGQFALWRIGATASRNRHPRTIALASELRTQLGIRRRVELLTHPCRTMPMTWGLFKTRLLLPVDSCDWNQDRIRAVLLHELAHIKRRDCITQLLVRLTCAIHWFNPLVWIAARKIATERERACDDLVLGSGVRASDYAEHLLEIATSCDDLPLAGTGALAMAKRSRLESRLTTILSRKTNRRGITPRVALTVGTALTVCALPVAMMQATAEDYPPGFTDTPPVTIKFMGEILSIDGEHQVAVVDMGSRDGIHVGTTLIVLRHSIAIARLKVVDSRDQMSGCLIEAKGYPSDFSPRVGDRVRIAATVNGSPERILGEQPEADVLYRALSGDGEIRIGDPDTETLVYPLHTGNWTWSVTGAGSGTVSFGPSDDSYGFAVGNASAYGAPLVPNFSRSEYDRINKVLLLPPPAAEPSIAEQAKAILAENPDNPVFQRMSKEMTQRKAERAEMMKYYTAKHPKVIAAEAAIETLERITVDLGKKAPPALPPAGPISGVGAALAIETLNGVVIREVIPGGPAHREGKLIVGDRIVAVGEGADGEWEPTVGKELFDVVKLIRGEAGSTVRLRLVRDDNGKPRPLEHQIVRGPIIIPPIPNEQVADRLLRTYQLQFVDAGEAAKAVAAIVGRKAEVVADERTNRLVIQAATVTHDLIELMLKELDVKN